MSHEQSPIRMGAAITGVLLATLLAYAQPASDPGGWGKAKWGMMPKGIFSVFPEAHALSGDPLRRIFDGKLSTIGVENIEIASTAFDAFMLFDSSGSGLNAVILQPKRLSRSLFATLEDDLTAKYGKPPERDIREVELRVKWRFPTTTIELLMTQSIGRPVAMSVTYGRRAVGSSNL